MPNEFIARNGVIALNNSIITGSLNVTQGITGSLFGTSSWAINALTASIVASTSNAFIQNGNSFGAQALLGTNDAQNLAFETNGTVRMLVSGSNGTVGIGTTTPGGINRASTRLDVRGTTWFSADDYGQLEIIPTTGDGGETVIRQYTTGPRNGGDLRIRVDAAIQGGNFIVATNNNTERFRITNAGATLVTGSLNISGSITTTGTITAQTLVVQTVTSSVSFMTGSTRFGSLLANTHQFTGSVSMTGSLNVTGTGTFSSTLQSAAATNGNGLTVKNASNNNILNLYANGTNDGVLQILNASAVEKIALYGNDGAATFAGNVGIGTTSPAYKLDVIGDIRLRGYNIGVDSSNNIKYVFTNDGGASYINSGNVGIGTTSPASLLHVVNPNSVAVASQPGITSQFVSNVDGRSIIRVENSNGNSTAGATGTALSLVSYSDSSNNPATNKHEAQILLGAKTSGQDGALRVIAPRNIDFYTNAQNVIMTGSAFTNYGTFAVTITSGSNIGIGTTSPSLKLDVSGSDAIFNGVRVGRGVGNISTNTMLGGATLYSNTTGANNIAIGYGASGLNTTGNQNTAVGTFALYTNTTGYAHTAIGYQALTNNTTGYNNTAVGYQTLISNTTGYNNTALGYQTLYNNTSAGGNVAIGHQALFSNTGSSNTAVGFTAGFNNRNIGSNTFIGSEAGYSNTTGGGNTIIGSGNYYLPSVIPFVSASNKISIAASGLPEIWSDTYSPEVSTNSNASALLINSEIYKGAVIDYAVESSDITSQRTGTIWLNFDYNGNITMNEQVTADIGDTTYYVFSATFSSPYINLILTNNSGTYTCVAGISCRLFKRYFAP